MTKVTAAAEGILIVCLAAEPDILLMSQVIFFIMSN